MTDQEIIKQISEEVRQSVGYYSTELKNQRTEALKYFYGEDFGNELEGRSSYVSPDVRDTILWIMPSLMRIFTGGDNIVRFEPQGPEDEKEADQATDYCNYVFQRMNDGFLVLYTWFMDALMSKNGFVKVYWDEYTEVKTDTYENLSDDEFVMLAQDDDIEILEHTQFDAPQETSEYSPPPQMGPMGPMGQPSPMMGQMGGQPGQMMPQAQQPIVLHDVKIRTKTTKGKCCITPIPPEEVLTNKNPIAPLSKNRFVAHMRKVSISELKEMGYKDVDNLKTVETFLDFDQETLARFSFDEPDIKDDPTDPVNRKIWICEAYICLDVDGDGIAEKRRITVAGDRILENEEAGSSKLISLTSCPVPHKLFGLSIYDIMWDLQLLKSTIFRQILDNMYLANNGRYMALDGMVNIDDLLTSRPGGIVRVKTFDAVKPMQPPLLGAPAFNLLEYVDHIKDVRTGINQDMQGLDPNTLNKTASAQANRLGAAQSRVELIARIFAETGVKDLFYAILEVVQKHENKPQTIRLRNQWVTMDPREWDNKYDLSVSVGLGTGTKDSIIQSLFQTLQFQLTCLQGGLQIVQPKNVYNAAMELLKAQSIKSGDLFFTDPTQVPPQQQPDPMAGEIEKAKIDAQAGIQKQAMKNDATLKKTVITLQGKAALRQAEMGMQDTQHMREMGVQNMQHQREMGVQNLQHQREMNVDIIKHNHELKNERTRDPGSQEPGS